MIKTIFPSQTQPFLKSLIRAIGVGAVAAGTYGSYIQYKDSYGPGGAAVVGLGKSIIQTRMLSNPILAVTYGVAWGGYQLAKHGRQQFTENRNRNFVRRTSDYYGNIRKMKHSSVQSMSNTHFRASRFIGNEATIIAGGD